MRACRSFVNEVRNQIDIEVRSDHGKDFDPVRVTIVGPYSRSENFLTRQEAEMLRDALAEALS